MEKIILDDYRTAEWEPTREIDGIPVVDNVLIRTYEDKERTKEIKRCNKHFYLNNDNRITLTINDYEDLLTGETDGSICFTRGEHSVHFTEFEKFLRRDFKVYTVEDAKRDIERMKKRDEENAREQREETD